MPAGSQFQPASIDAGPQKRRVMTNKGRNLQPCRCTITDGTQQPPPSFGDGPPNHTPYQYEVHGSARRFPRSPGHSGHPLKERMVRLTTHHSKRKCMGRSGACHTTALVLFDVLRCARQAASKQRIPHKWATTQSPVPKARPVRRRSRKLKDGFRPPPPPRIQTGRPERYEDGGDSGRPRYPLADQ